MLRVDGTLFPTDRYSVLVPFRAAPWARCLPSVLWKWLPTLYFFAALDLPLMITASSAAGAR